MGLSSSIRAGLGFLKRTVDYRSLATARLIQRNLANVAVPLRPAGRDRIACEGLGLIFNPVRQPFYLERMVIARDLVTGGHGEFVSIEGELPEFRSGAVRIVPETADDFAVLEEVFVRRLYVFAPNREPFVLDIGMNVGVASLFYAGIKGWPVLAFEPFPATFAAAGRNVVRSGLADQVHLRCAGVAAESGTLEVAYNPEARATNGLFGNIDSTRTTADARITIDLFGADEALDEALGLAGGRPILAKIDCEGAEYEILERWAASDRLDRIAAMVVEYHRIRPDHTPERIVDLLRGRGFVIQRLWTMPEAGGLFAIRAEI